MNGRTFSDRLFFVIKLLMGILIVAPILYAALVSFMNPAEVSSYPPAIFPKNFQLTNYLAILNIFPLFRFLLNSIIVCLIVIAAQILISSLSAYAFSFFEFPGRNLLFALILSTMMIPAETVIIANYLTMCDLKLVNTYFALVLPYLASGMGIFLMRQFFLTVPRELKQAAAIDGCGDLRFLWSVLMPISVPTIAALSVYVFVLTYNQYMWPLFVTSSTNMRTVQVGMGMLIDAETTNYGNVTAGAIFVLIPVVLIFILGQKYLIRGMTSGAVKG